MTRPKPETRVQAGDVVRSTLDDHTVEQMRTAAARRGVSLDQLIADLLRAASNQIDDLLDSPFGEPQSGISD